MGAVYLVVVLVLIQYIAFGILVGSAREKYKVDAPAITGDPIFERYFRVQMNTLEQLIAFIPALLIASLYWSPNLVAAIGVVFFIGRLIYLKSYVSDPKKRTIGFGLTLLPTMVLLVMIVAGIIRTALN